MPEAIEVKKANVELHKRAAQFFEEKNIELFNVFEQYNLDERIKRVDQTCKRHKFRCDIVCGTGNVIKKQITRFENVIGLDISRKMIEVCKAREVSRNAHFIIGDAENLPFRDNTFDIVTMHAALHHVPSTLKCLKETNRILPKERIMYIDHEPNSKQIRNLLKKIKKIKINHRYKGK